ncbi:MAG: FkbM family methyltransferase [Proteobacteria bacterium]|nr:FkbM family methyltransferase [Pseudomonadota bacterium]
MRSPRPLLRLKDGTSISAPSHEPIPEILREIWIDRCYAPRTGALEALGPGVIVDIGAHVGLFTLWAKSVWPSARVVALEPSHTMFSYLARNIADNALQDVVPIQVGCAGKNELRPLYAGGHEGANTMYIRDGIVGLKHDIQVWSLDHLFQKMNITNCPLLKLDCEGAEYEILFNASDETLSNIANITMEYHVGFNAFGPADMQLFLESRGFSVTVKSMDDESGYILAQRMP